MAEQVLANIGQTASALFSRFPKHTFTFSEEDKELETDPSSITMRQLSYGEEQQALQAAEANKTTFLAEASMRAIVAVDGKEVTWENDGKDRAFRGMSNKVRELTMQAFADIGLPTPESRKAFLASKKTTL